MTWAPISPHEWETLADERFWQPYARKRSDRLKVKMIGQQFKQLHNEAPTIANAFVSRITLDPNETTYVRAQCFKLLAQAAIANGDINVGIDHSMHYFKLLPIEGLPVLVELLYEYDQRNRAAEAIAVWQQATRALDQSLDYLVELQVAALLALAGHEEEARELANRAFETQAAQTKRGGPLTYAFNSRAVNRVLFSLARRGGVVRFVGLLGTDSKLVPKSLGAKLAKTVYFNQATIETWPSRLVVDLDEFSLDFHWTTDSSAIQRAKRRYESVPYEDRRHIPPRPLQCKQALIVLAIGDDTSLPEVINPMIELVDLLDGWGECLFYERIGPLSRRDDLEPFERVSMAQIDKLIRSQLKPLFVAAGFEHCTTRRFVMTQGPLGYAAGVFLRIDKTSLVVSAQLQIYYRDLLEDDALKRYYNNAGEFQPKAFLIAQSQYISQIETWKPEDPSYDAIAHLIDRIAATFQNDWLPLVQRTRDPRLELAWMLENLKSICHTKLWQSKYRFAAHTKGELAVEMARFIGAHDLEAALSKKLSRLTVDDEND